MATFTAGMKLTAALLEALVSDWSSGTPSWSATGNPTIGNGTLSHRWKQVGKMVVVEGALVGGGTTTWGTAGNQHTFGLPVNRDITSPYDDLRIIGDVEFFDTSTNLRYAYKAVSSSATGFLVAVRLGNSAVPAAGTITTFNNGTPVTPATGDELSWKLEYKAA